MSVIEWFIGDATFMALEHGLEREYSERVLGMQTDKTVPLGNHH